MDYNEMFYYCGYSTQQNNLQVSIAELPYCNSEWLESYHTGFIDSMIDKGLENSPAYDLYVSIFVK